MQLAPYLTFNGQCEEAFKFYESCLSGKIEAMLPWQGSPAEGHVPENFRSKIMHARIIVNGQELMGADNPPADCEKPQGFSISIGLSDPAEAERIFQALSENGTVRMPLQQTFWAAKFGMLVDRFGIPWMINCEQPA